MVDEGELAPEFSLPMAQGRAYNDIEEFSLSDALAEGPVVLAFVPAAFTSGCTDELCTFTDSLAAFEELDAGVYGLSADLSFAQNVWMQRDGIDVPLLADQDREVIRAYDVVLEDMYGYFEVANRSVFVVREDGTVAYKWVKGEENPDFEELAAEIRDELAAL
ncbi:redoxin domain-containing protein [Haloplanus sp. GCM10025708]|uniref:redoxin domain-containing protein n=1 Tax=Haloferacaceae TaxID=1644056 RepID=UPI003614FC16